VAARRRDCQGRPVDLASVAARFALGRPVRPPVPVTGGLSNQLWRLDTDRGTYAIKRMVVNADRPGFVPNVEAAYQVERHAWAAGVPMPEPVPAGGRALAPIEGSLFRVHRWVGARPGAGSATEAAALLAAVHAAGRPRWQHPPEPPWRGDAWGDDIARLARRVAAAPDRILVVDSHRDLDRKNTLRRDHDGALIALDWDAAGPAGAAHEAMAVALDWSGADPAAAVRAYTRLSGVAVPDVDWVYGGWVAAQGGWLDYQATQPTGHAEVTAALDRLRRLAAALDGRAGAPDHP
jgi:Phosphotransferase enzyme family